MAQMHVREGVVIARKQIAPRLWQLNVLSDGQLRPALLYEQLLPVADVGATVVVNTTALDLRLGTGGFDFVLHVLRRADAQRRDDPPAAGDNRDGDPAGHIGHIMKLRYTPLQLRVLSVEEEDSPHRETMLQADDVGGMPAVVLELHSQLAPAAAALRHALGRDARIVYVMTDGAALPVDFSHSVRQLRAAAFIDGAVTTGDSFGGDLEAVTLFSGLLAARHVLHADAAVVAPGPGVVGTGTTFGTTAVAVGQSADAIGIVGGVAFVAPRISFADARPRHRGVSHHTLTALGRVAQRRCHVVLPRLSAPEDGLVRQQLADASIVARHHVVVESRGDDALRMLAEAGIALRSMGRDAATERALFLSAAAAGYAAADEVNRT